MSKQIGGSLVDKERGNKNKEKEGKQTRGGKKNNRIEIERERKWRFSWRSDGRISMVQELKLVNATRATCGYQNLGVSSNSKR